MVLPSASCSGLMKSVAPHSIAAPCTATPTTSAAVPGLGFDCQQRQRATPPHRPREDGLTHPANISRTHLALLSRWRLSKPSLCPSRARTGRLLIRVDVDGDDTGGLGQHCRFDHRETHGTHTEHRHSGACLHLRRVLNSAPPGRHPAPAHTARERLVRLLCY
jgi:hypothetical protein